MLTIVLAVVLVICGAGNSARVGNITVSNGGPNGIWRFPGNCPLFQHAIGFYTKVEPEHGLFEDDTAVNGICIACANNVNTTATTKVCSGEGDFGVEAGYFPCPVINGIQSYLVAFQLKVDPEDGNTDETAVNNIKFKCLPKGATEPEYEVEGFGLDLHGATYGEWSNYCPPDSAVCGIQTKVQPDQSILDDTALNDVQFDCCDWGFQEESEDY